MWKSQSKEWFAAHTRRNQEKSIKARLEKIGVEHFIPFRTEIRQRKDRKIQLSVPVIPNIVFIFADYKTSLSIVNEYGVKISYLKAIDGNGPLIVPFKQLEDFKLICEANVPCTLVESLTTGDRVVVVGGSLSGLEGELIKGNKNSKRMIVRLDGIAAFEIVIAVKDLKKIDKL